MTGIWNKIVDKKEIFLKAFLVLALFLPAYYSPFEPGYLSNYYVGFLWPYCFLAVYMLLSFLGGEKRRGNWFAGIFAALVLVYQALALYFDFKYLGWYWEAINNTLSFLFFALLLYHEEEYRNRTPGLMRFTIVAIGGSTLLSVLYSFTDYTGLYFCNNQILTYLSDITYENRNYWLYSHKSDYALMLIVFLALVLRWYSCFEKKGRWVPWVTLVLLGVAVWQTHSWTGIVGALFVVGGFILDRINWKAFKAWYFVVAGVLAVAAAGVFYKIVQERDVLELGGRFGIWEGALAVIKKYPEGWGMRFGESMIETTQGWMVNNAHNVFLNALLRFSTPVGICFCLIFLVIIIATLWRGKSFLAAGMWAGMLMLMTMDYSLLNFEMAMVLFCVYFVCMRKKEKL